MFDNPTGTPGSQPEAQDIFSQPPPLGGGVPPSPAPAGGPPSLPTNMPVAPASVHTMPEKFMGGGGSASGGAAPSGRGGRKLTMILIIVLVVVALGGGGFFLYQRFAATSTNTNTNVAVQNLNTNVNQNLNVNGNENLNVSLNSNTNTTTNLNANTNLNTNSATNLNSNTNSSINTNTSVSAGTPLPSTVDADGDGLTDVEEQSYTTDKSKADTDADGFIDGRTLQNGILLGEVALGYNPKGTGRLDASGLVRLFTNSSFRYSTLYPSSWVAQATASDNQTVLFTPPDGTGELVQVLVQDNPSKLSARDWYSAANPGVSSTVIANVVVNALEGVQTADGNNVYLAKEDKIYILTYSVGALTSVNFRSTFEMMVSNFRLVPATNVTTNTNTTTSNTNT